MQFQKNFKKGRSTIPAFMYLFFGQATQNRQIKSRIILLPNLAKKFIYKNYLLAMLFSTCWIIFLTIFPPILPASLEEISPL